MQRRDILTSAGALALLGVGSRVSGAEAATVMPGWREFEITTRVTLEEAPGAAQLWLPLAQTAGGYQAATALRWQSSGASTVVRDDRYGAEILKTTWEPAAAGPKTIEVVQRVAACDRQGATTGMPMTVAERGFWRQATESVPTDGIVRDTALRVIGDRTAPREKLRALYDWVVDNTSRDPEVPGCGFGDVRSMLESGNLSGKCADINGLMTGLARAAGFAARDVYGIRVAPSTQFRTLGASGDISKAQHCRTEVFLEEEGWLPLDPADVRKVVLEHRLPLDGAEVRALRERLFGGWEMNWVGYNSAMDIELPGAGAGRKPNFAFLMYPCAFTAAGQPDCLRPDQFRYEINAREISA
ncbi:transglutaminase domain-containing protein [Roseomonas ludipueritiae]|uniref:Transglutaminase domain-containing protein n=2 Tax=Pseudoroseomonas ludipueritiae TaxID=198093 RepID=A0ABR7R1U5_9PROT|nr:transglutaminase domain-containing protein [Pseudoroseomonas ludipueritiae]